MILRGAGLLLLFACTLPAQAQPRERPPPDYLGTIPVMPIPADPVEIAGAAQDTLDAVTDRIMDLGPLRNALGPTGEGAVGAAIIGRDRSRIPGLEGTFVSSGMGLSMDTGAYLEYAVDGAWSGVAGSASVASFALRPGLDFVFAKWSADSGPRSDALTDEQRAECDARFDAYVMGRKTPRGRCPSYEPPVYFMSVSAFGELRYRYAELDILGARAAVNQSILGGGLEWFVPIKSRWAIFREFPRVSVAYYTVEDTETTAAVLPADLEADYLAASGRIRLNIPLFRRVSLTPQRRAVEDYPLRLYGDYEGRRATAGPLRAWHSLWTAQLVYDVGNSLMPVISYRAGTEAGADYDAQWIFGVAWALAGSSAKR